jgi:hypothetical protein
VRPPWSRPMVSWPFDAPNRELPDGVTQGLEHALAGIACRDRGADGAALATWDVSELTTASR